ncbi:MAG: helix-turn-helix domain-containing protein, partial [Nitrososphaeraceae archaeon]|nr:helix-turn-helix domain-containing protein [Nitrososphaeraceae archaeon]
SNRKELTNLYKKESDPKVKERLLLVLKVRVDDMIPARVARELYRSRTWASDWLARYSKEGVEGLKNKPKSGRPPKLSREIVLKIRRKLIGSKQGWSTKQIQDMIIRESGGGVKYHYIYMYRLLHKWGFKLKVPRKIHINTASNEERRAFKKERRKY